MSCRVLFVPLLLLVSVLWTYCPDATASEQPAAKSATTSPFGSGERQGEENSLPPRVGKEAPNFTLKTLDGKPVQLSKLTAHGPVVILVLRGWPGYQCPICTRQMGEFLTKAEEFQAQEASVVLVYPGPAENLADHAKEFLGGKHLPSGFSFVTDPDYAFTELYQLRWDAPKETAYPSTFVIDQKGIVRFAQVSKTHAGRTSAKEVLEIVTDNAPEVDLGEEAATHVEVEPLDVEFQSLTSLRLHPDGDLLACDGQAKRIKIISPGGELKGTIPLQFGPEAIDTAPEGIIYCGGEGQLVVMDKSGKLLHDAESPGDAETDMSKARRKISRAVQVSGIAVSGESVFAAFGSGWSTGSKSKLFRFDRQLEAPVLIAEGLRGCCQRCDVVARDRILYLAENGAHRVVAYGSGGEILGKWGERSRTDLEGFGSCCNPMNLCFDAAGVLYTAESGLGRVKRYSPSGEYLGLVGYVGVERFTRASGMAASCSNIAIDVTSDGKTVYVMDFKNNKIRVLRQKG